MGNIKFLYIKVNLGRKKLEEMIIKKLVYIIKLVYNNKGKKLWNCQPKKKTKGE